MRIIPGFVFLLIISLVGKSQDQNSSKPAKKVKVNFASYNTFNLLHSVESVHAGLQTVNGVSINNTFIGAGVAIDWYGMRSVPMFADFRQVFNLGRATFFAYGDIGYNGPWYKKEPATMWGYSHQSTDGGIYYDIGAGYLIPFRKRNAMILSAGYSVKEMAKSYQQVGWGWPTEEDLYEKFNYKYRRLSVKIGWRF
ncbi:hypothetical protein [Pollutibacter soli]|uniref:hypothetical protein n=1 Tax=Pollutibacter soli TaxID=3034157 RepID=UPI00301374FC